MTVFLLPVNFRALLVKHLLYFLLMNLVFGRSTEKTSKSSGNPQKRSSSDRRKGQQKGEKGHGRKSITTLPVIPEDIIIPAEQQQFYLLLMIPPPTENSASSLTTNL